MPRPRMEFKDSKMTMTRKIPLLLVISANFLLSEASMPGGVCPSMEYTTAVGSCLTDYIYGMIRGAKGTEQLRAYHRTTCRNGLVKRTIDCVKEADRMCAYSYVHTDALTAATEILCARYTVIVNGPRCKVNVSALVECGKDVVIDTNNPICSATKAITKCVTAMISPCGTEVTKFTSDIIETWSLGHCNGMGVQTGVAQSCALLPYATSAAACYAPFASRIPQLLKDNQGKRAVEILQAICGLPQMNEGMQCHQEVDERCRMSMVDAGKMRRVMDTVCAKAAEIVTIGQCFKKDKESTKENLRCLSAARATSVCPLVTGSKSCLLPFFAPCPQGIKTFVNRAYDLVVPSACDKTNSRTKCSALAYMVDMTACWSQSILGLTAKIAPSISETLGSPTCDMAGIARSKRCHDDLDSTCDVSFMRPAGLRDIFALLCNDIKVIGRFSPCLRKSTQPFLDCMDKIDLLKAPVNNQNDLCKLVNQLRDCSLVMFTGTKCDASVTKLMTNAVDSVVPFQCRPKTSSATAIQRSTIVVVLLSFLVLFA